MCKTVAGCVFAQIIPQAGGSVDKSLGESQWRGCQGKRIHAELQQAYLRDSWIVEGDGLQAEDVADAPSGLT